MSNELKKFYFKKATQHFVKYVDLTNLKQNIDKLGIGRLETTHVDLYKVSDVIINEVAKKDM